MAATQKAKPAAKPGAGGGEDQSMEEILQSIRKIIAEESDGTEAAPASAIAIDSVPDSDSDVLELTDMVQDDGSVVNLTDQENDVLSSIDRALEAEEEDEPAVAAPPPPPPPPAPQIVERAAPRPAPRRPVATDSGDGLVSNLSIAAAAEAMRALRQPGTTGTFGALSFLSGDTVEGLVAHILRPMLKEWLDANLPAIVQQEVQREVQRIAASLDE